MKTQYLGGSQDVVCKIHQPSLLVTQALFMTVSFHLLGAVLAILLPVVRVCLTPLARAFQANLSINGIGSDLLPMIITAALALTLGLAANKLSRMIRGRLKDLLTVTTMVIFHGGFREERKGVLSGSAIRRDPHTQELMTRTEKDAAVMP